MGFPYAYSRVIGVFDWDKPPNVGPARYPTMSCRIWPDLKAHREGLTVGVSALWTHIMICPAENTLYDGRNGTVDPWQIHPKSDWFAFTPYATSAWFRAVMVTECFSGEVGIRQQRVLLARLRGDNDTGGIAP